MSAYRDPDYDRHNRRGVIARWANREHDAMVWAKDTPGADRREIMLIVLLADIAQTLQQIADALPELPKP